MGMNRPPFFENFANWVLVFASCIREIAPSCILAPPEEQIRMNGTFFSPARTMDLDTASPTTEPMLPPINEKFIIDKITSLSLILPS